MHGNKWCTCNKVNAKYESIRWLLSAEQCECIVSKVVQRYTYLHRFNDPPQAHA